MSINFCKTKIIVEGTPLSPLEKKKNIMYIFKETHVIFNYTFFLSTVIAYYVIKETSVNSRVEIMQSIFSDLNTVKPEMNNKRLSNTKYVTTRKLNYILCIAVESKKK